MDEPASALDPIATARIEELIRELRESYTIVIVTHSMQQAARVSQTHRVLLHGRAGRGRRHEADLHAPAREADRGLHHGPVRLTPDAAKRSKIRTRSAQGDIAHATHRIAHPLDLDLPGRPLARCVQRWTSRSRAAAGEQAADRAAAASPSRAPTRWSILAQRWAERLHARQPGHHAPGVGRRLAAPASRRSSTARPTSRTRAVRSRTASARSSQSSVARSRSRRRSRSTRSRSTCTSRTRSRSLTVAAAQRHLPRPRDELESSSAAPTARSSSTAARTTRARTRTSRSTCSKDEDFAATAQTLPGTAAVINAVSARSERHRLRRHRLRDRRAHGAHRGEGEEPIEPTMANAISGRYPLSRFLFMVTRGEPQGTARRVHRLGALAGRAGARRRSASIRCRRGRGRSRRSRADGAGCGRSRPTAPAEAAPTAP